MPLSHHIVRSLPVATALLFFLFSERPALATCYCPIGYAATAVNVPDGSGGVSASEFCSKNGSITATVNCAYSPGYYAQTQTETTSNPATNGYAQTSSVATAVTSAVGTATQSMANIALSEPYTQAGTVNAAANVALTGANNQANAGLLTCAQGGNKELESPGSGVDDVAECQGYFKNSDELLKMAGKNGNAGGLRPDEGMLGEPSAQSALNKFQSNFGIDKDEYVRRMLESHGSRAEFTDMLSSKLSEAKLDKLFAAADEAQPASPVEAAVADASTEVTGVKAIKKETSLRDSLRAKLAGKAEARSLASKIPESSQAPSGMALGEKLQPAGLEHWVDGANEDSEASLTIFDVVHQKLQSLRQRERI